MKIFAIAALALLAACDKPHDDGRFTRQAGPREYLDPQETIHARAGEEFLVGLWCNSLMKDRQWDLVRTEGAIVVNIGTKSGPSDASNWNRVTFWRFQAKSAGEICLEFESGRRPGSPPSARRSIRVVVE